MIINAKDFGKVLSFVGLSIPNKAALPILESVKLSSKDGYLYAVGTDLEIANGYKIYTEGDIDTICVPYKRLNAIVRKMSGNITLKTENNVLNIDTTSGSYQIAGYSGDDYPNLNSVSLSNEVDMDWVSKMMSEVSVCMDTNDLYPMLAGQYFNFDGSSVRIAATDQHVLGEISCDMDVNSEMEFILPSRSVNAIIKAENLGVCKVGLSDSDFSIVTSDGRWIQSRIIPEKYPNYKAVIPSGFNSEYNINKKELLAAIDRLNAFSENSSHPIICDFSTNGLKMKVDDPYFECNAEEVVHVDGGGEPVKIKLNGKYMYNVVRNIRSEDVDVQLISHDKACKFINEDQLFIVMPIQL